MSSTTKTVKAIELPWVRQVVFVEGMIRTTNWVKDPENFAIIKFANEIILWEKETRGSNNFAFLTNPLLEQFEVQQISTLAQVRSMRGAHNHMNVIFPHPKQGGILYVCFASVENEDHGALLRWRNPGNSSVVLKVISIIIMCLYQVSAHPIYDVFANRCSWIVVAP